MFRGDTEHLGLRKVGVEVGRGEEHCVNLAFQTRIKNKS